MVAPGDGIINPAKLKPYDNAFVVHLVRTDGVDVNPGIWTDQLRMREIKGRKVWVRIQSLGYFDGRVYTSVNMFDPISFAPISTAVDNPDGTKERWTYTATSADGHITAPDGKESEQHIPLPKPAFDFNCCMRSLIPAALPLVVGKSFTMRGIVDGDEIVTYHVDGRERIKAGYLGTVEAWKVTTFIPGGPGGSATFWISDTPPHLVHMTLQNVPANKMPDGVHYDQSYDMIGEPTAQR